MQSGKLSTEAAPPLSAEELKSVLGDAIRRQGEDERAREAVASLMTEADAYEVARSLNISEAHVEAALEARHESTLRQKKREHARQKRLAGVIMAVVFTALAGAITLIPFLPWVKFIPLLIAAAATLFLFLRWMGPVSDREADAVDLPPQPGVCQKCGAPAVSPTSTLCGRHTFGGGAG